MTGVFDRSTRGVTLVAALTAAAGVAATPAAAARSKVTCERIAGKTLAASSQVRVLVLPAGSGFETSISACRIGSRSFQRVAVGRGSVRLAQVAVRGRWAAVAGQTLVSGEDRKDSGVATSPLWLFDGQTGKARDADNPSGLTVRELALSASGIMGVIADPFGLAYGTTGQPNSPLTNGGVFSVDARVKSGAAWQRLDEAAPASLAGLGTSGDLIVWQHDGAMRSASPAPAG